MRGTIAKPQATWRPARRTETVRRTRTAAHFAHSRPAARAVTDSFMRTDNGRTVSFWMASADTPAGAPLDQDVRADVCVIGAGIAGMSVAYELSKEGRKVVVLDDGPTAGGETSRTTAHLVFYNDDGLTKIEQLHGTEGLRLATESHSAAVDRIERNARDEGIDCDFYRVDGYLFVS